MQPHTKTLVILWGAFVTALTVAVALLVDAQDLWDSPRLKWIEVSGFLVFVGLVFWELRRLMAQVQSLEEVQRPKLSLVHRATETRPFVQVLRFPAQASNGQTVELEDRRCRVGVLNVSAIDVSQVRVVLQSCEPGGNFVFPEQALLVHGTDPESGTCTVAPPPKGSDLPDQLVDVVNELGVAGAEIPDSIQLCYANPNIRQPIPAGNYVITLRVVGGNASKTRQFRIIKHITNADGKTQVVPVRLEALTV
jgi:hypothetical protein